MKLLKFFFFIYSLILVYSCNPKKETYKTSNYNSSIVINNQHIGCKDNLYGFEGGDVKKIKDTFHLIINERFKKLATTNNRFGYWQSTNGKQWTRKKTMLSFPYDTLGKIPNSCIYNPKFIFSKKKQLWYLYYIQYKSEPSRKGGWYKKYDGQIMLCQSKTKGTQGISGPYTSGKCIFKKPKYSTWEGLQGITGFAPYKVDDKWYALYGSATTENAPNTSWYIGLASAHSLEGPWQPELNHKPIKIPFGAESPVVLKRKGHYFALLDEISGNENFSLITSTDGKQWKYSNELTFLAKEKWQWKEIRTPIGFFEYENKMHTYFTTYYKNTDFAPLRHLEFEINKE